MRDATEYFFSHSLAWQKRIFSAHVRCIDSMQSITAKAMKHLESIAQEYDKPEEKRNGEKMRFRKHEVNKAIKQLNGISEQLVMLLMDPKRTAVVQEGKEAYAKNRKSRNSHDENSDNEALLDV